MPPPAPLPPVDDVGTLFDLLPVGAYRTTPDGRQLRANAALVRMNGYATEAEMLASVGDIGTEWYVEPGRRDEFRRRLEAEGELVGFVSEVWRHRTRERIWVSENAHLVRGPDGAVRYYEGTVEDITARVQADAALAASEERLRLMTSQLPGMAFRSEFGPDGRRRYVYASEGARALFGVEPQDVIADARVLSRLVHPDDRARMDAEIAASTRDRRPLVMQFRVVLADGRLRWIQSSSALAADDGSGRVVRNGVMFDVTELKLAEQALRDADARWKLALDATGDGVWDWNLATGEEVFSDRFLELYGFAPGELPERHESFDARTHPDDVARMQRDRDDHLAGRTPRYVNEHRVRCKDGSWKWVLSRGLVIARDAEGRPLRMIGTHTDITVRRQAEVLRAERDRAEAADRTKSELLARVSHELRTPLNAVIGFGQLLDNAGMLDERRRAWAGQIVASGRQLLELVEHLLDLAGAQRAQLELQLDVVDLVALVDDAWRLLAGVAAEATVTLDRGGLPARPVSAQADRRRAQQVVGALLSNAVRYNRAGGWVRVRATHEGTQAVLAVEDSGRGLTPEQIDRLFRPFERVDDGPDAVPPGAGLGLAVARELVDAMGGAIAVESRPGVGSVFSVRLPAAM